MQVAVGLQHRYSRPPMDSRFAAAELYDCVPEPDTPSVLPPLIGHSAVFSRVRHDIACLAAIDAPAVIGGEPGTGKSLLARAVHAASSRASGPFVAVPCARLPETLLEIELFGCVKGSVVGASSDRVGVLDVAHGGTVLLEDVEEMTLRTQGLLLRFLENGEVNRVGTFGAGTPSDVRLLFSASARLDTRVADGVFREELRSCLAARQLVAPSLRDRKDDIPVLVDYFARVATTGNERRAVTFTLEAHSALEAYSWPGNVRELRRVVERLVLSARSEVIGAEDLPVGIRPRRLGAAKDRRERRRTVGEDLFMRLLQGGESFWSAVYPMFMQREITRSDVRDLVRRGLEAARGNYSTLVRLLNMPASDQRKFLGFLRRYGCELTPQK
jgi:DNA-binding NtrC family response regulator